MIKFLLQRPIAVLMAFTACFILGLATYFSLPVSLLPDIAIPEITVQVAGENRSARELENTIVKPIRLQLMQLSGLRDIKSEARDGSGIIRLSFDFGTNTELAFIEVNEKIDAAMNYLPRDAERPRVVKASATDIPVFCLNLTLRSDKGGEQDEEAFLNLSEFAETVIKRRIEQLPEVAMVDMTGQVGRELQIVPDRAIMEMAGITQEDIEMALTANNIEPGSMTVRDGYYEYNIKFSTLLRTEDDVRNIYLRKGGRIFQLKDLSKISIIPEKSAGASLSAGKRAVTLAVIKQADENMDNMNEALQETMDYFAGIYPDIEFSISRNQTELLDYTISNLKQNLSLGFVFICIVAVLFLGDVKSPAVIGLSMVVSLVISLLFFYLFNMSLNIISLSGLILALGMMIDSSIVVTENIAQYRARGETLERACDLGTTEVITPMLSSTLTTIAVFVPLVFMSGIAGAIFYDQAFAVTVGLMVSYFTGIGLLPVLYKLVYMYGTRGWLARQWGHDSGNNRLRAWYDKGIDFVFRHKRSNVLALVLTIPLCVFCFYQIPTSRMPEIDQNELIMRVEWNENIHLDENRARVEALCNQVDSLGAEHTAYIGRQQFLLNRDKELSATEAEVYFRTSDPKEIDPLQNRISKWIKQNYPTAVVAFSPPETVFEKLFVTGEADVVAELYARNKALAPKADSIRLIEQGIADATGLNPSGVAFDNQLNITIDQEKLLLYQVSYSEVYRVLKTAFRANQVAMLRSYQQYLPITVTDKERTVNEVLENTLVYTQPKAGNGAPAPIPLRELVTVSHGEDLKAITSGKNGEFVPLSFYKVDDAEALMTGARDEVARTNKWDVAFSGAFFSNAKMLRELVLILMLSILLMYFILAAQFESFLQPLIVLAEIPIDVAAALLILWITGHTLNLMSAIGIVVTCGIIINDSILKIDAMNELRKEGVPLLEAIHEAGHRRLRPIVMTSLTTVFGMVPLLFSFDMGSELQKPLAIAMISAMVVGTAISLLVIPMVYWLIYRKKEIVKA
ncbi:MAG: efflux RND transporter permease subunit [Parabacteroides sp.]|uniref:efflux RND transporter permease subunit n=1 Tax=Macellibacteroides sp. TaxID=2014584 RepID=UPI002A14093F|nr:efflux RND transporter permease subunit [Parabacteroides sp.]